MRAAVLPAYGETMEIRDLTLREPGPGEVIVDVDAVAVCLTDVLGSEGLTMVPAPFVGGHSGTGIVREIGEGVTRVKVGDRIATAGGAQCTLCHACTHGTPAACDHIFGGMVPPRVIGQAGGVDINAEGGVGLFAEQALLRETVLAPIPADLPPVAASMLGCGVIGGLGAVLNVARVRLGDTVVIVGAGHLGLWMLRGAQIAGASTVTVIESLEGRRKTAAALGADHVLDPAEVDVVQAVRDLTNGRGADVALEAAGTGSGIELAAQLSRGGGTVVYTSMAWPGDTVPMPTLDLTVSAKRFLSSQSGGGDLLRDLPAYAQLFRDGTLDADVIAEKTFTLEQINDAFETARRREVLTGVVLP
ncbi:zinc-binding dehydrogenase [Gordonia terrae]|uniref:zinc-binding dehydrogenase n=1 Tax=Gordonia hongkongensis TaxID=1701090 RepID=UPI0022B37E55|nr:zinc-binding dehydrogenase [Gordonia terrae]